jgi:tetratricopeptide (TPR) repeat protein
MHRARIYLAAGDYRRAIDACLQAVGEAPSAETYTYLTYAYHALNGYIEHLAKHDRWVAVEQLARSLLYRGPGDLTDPPEVLARIAKELMQQSVQQQADITAAMANRLGKDLVDRLWRQQSAWRAAHPEEWFYGAPPEWGW